MKSDNHSYKFDIWSLIKVLLVQALVIFNDNAAKVILIGLAQFVLLANEASHVVHTMAALLVVPFIFFSPLAGWVSDRFAKKDVLWATSLLQVLIICVMLGALSLNSIKLSVACFFLLALQSTFFSPAKLGILKELAGSKKLSVAVGWMQMTGMAAILAGTYLGGRMIDASAMAYGSWYGAIISIGILGALSVLILPAFWGMKGISAKSHETFRWPLLWSHAESLKGVWNHKGMRMASMGVSFFYFLGGYIFLTLVQIGHQKFGSEVGAASLTGFLSVILVGGVCLGSMCAAWWSKNRLQLGLVVVGGFAMPIFLTTLWMLGSDSVWFRLALGCLGFSGGVFLVPLQAYLQDTAVEDHRGRVMATVNLLTNIGGIAAVLAQSLLSGSFSWTVEQQCLFLVPISILVAFWSLTLLPGDLVRLIGFTLVKLFYRARIKNEHFIPEKGGALMVCNHVSYVDAVLLQVACPRHIRFIAFSGFFKMPLLGRILKVLNCIPISQAGARDAMRVAAESLKQGDLVCIFPEAELTRTGELLAFRKGFEIIARKADVPVIPAHLDSLWGSIFSFYGNRYFWKWPQSLPKPVGVSFGNPIPAKEATALRARQAVLDLGEQAFRERPELNKTLGEEIVNAWSKRPRAKSLVDFTRDAKEWRNGKLLVLSLALANKWKQVKSQRVGVALPPGVAGILANVGLTLAGKTPVNLNVTVGRDTAEWSLKLAGIQTVITAPELKKRFSQYPWPSDVRMIMEEVKDMNKLLLVLNTLAVYVLPSFIVKLFLREIAYYSVKPNDEATVLFTSGSSGKPKGVVLTHRNILANIAQVSGTNLLQKQEVLLGALPLFHSFGITMGMWLPVLKGCKLVTVPSPLDSKKIGQAAREGDVTMLLGTPTFLRSYAKRLHAEHFQSVKYVLAGAEKLPVELAEIYRKKFQIEILQGYGLTETSPVISVNTGNPEMGPGAESRQLGNRLGSVGRLIPGMTARIIHTETREELSLDQTGLILVKGVNVFKGYFKDKEKTEEVLCNQWFCTGDIGRFDEDGFLFIEGRLSRFSKIGGEMVSHGAVEEKLGELYPVEAGGGHVIVGIPHESKGESLVLLTTSDLSSESVKHDMQEAGMANLWIPKEIFHINEIPLLGSGKLDLKACQKIVCQELLK